MSGNRSTYIEPPLSRTEQAIVITVTALICFAVPVLVAAGIGEMVIR